MKKILLFLSLSLFAVAALAQSKVDSLIAQGVHFHDQGEYEKAMEAYEHALEIEPKSPLANYEMSLTCMYAGDYKKGLEYSDKVIKMKDKYMLEAYVTKGSCLDYLGKTKKSVKLFKKAIKKYGGHHLLHYNLAINYYKLQEFDETEENLVAAIAANPSHASSHFVLGLLMHDRGNRVQSLLSLHYFLHLEPNSKRSAQAYDLLAKQFGGNVERSADKPNEINIFVDAGSLESEFSAADMMISMLEASRSLEKNEGKTDEELFRDNTTSFFKILGELNDQEHNKSLWWEMYIPYFYELAQTEHMEAYCNVISQSANANAAQWLQSNAAQTGTYEEWRQSKVSP